MSNGNLLVRNLKQLVCVVFNGARLLKGHDMNNIAIFERYSVVVDEDGIIEAVGKTEEIDEIYKGKTFQTTIDGTNLCAVPGLCDGHTHPVWAGDRVHEFAMKLAGKTYMEIHAQGGGIGFTVKHTKAASEEDLLHLLIPRLKRMQKYGTTLVECKSGYGLETETEMKMLKVIKQASKQMDMSFSITYLGAHSIPHGKTEEEATNDIITNQIPALKKLKEEGNINVDNIDVFCEKGVYSVESSRKILKAGKDIGLQINFHGDEINPMNSGELAGEIGAKAVSHLERVSEAGMKSMAENECVAVLLPSTAFLLRLEPPPARRMIELGVPVALGSDFNPNAHCLSMAMIMNMACVMMRMTMNEALAAATINSAASMGLADKHGSIEIGKFGNLVLIEAETWEHLIYQMVDPPIKHVIYRGKVVT